MRERERESEDKGLPLRLLRRDMATKVDPGDKSALPMSMTAFSSVYPW